MNSKERERVCEFEEDGRKYRLTVNYGFTKIGDQEPYFSITSDLHVWNGYTWRLESCGCQHDLIHKHMPELSYLTKWHLCSVKTGPMHYEVNGMFWWERSLMKVLVPAYHGDTCAIGEKALEYFKSTIVYGSADSYDRIEESVFKYGNDSDTCKQFMRAWLKERFTEVMQSFQADMRKCGLLMGKKRTP